MVSIVALRMIKALVRLGWSVDRASGTSHHVLTKEGYRPITVPVKKGRTLKEGTARAILRQAGVRRMSCSTSTDDAALAGLIGEAIALLRRREPEPDDLVRIQ